MIHFLQVLQSPPEFFVFLIVSAHAHLVLVDFLSVSEDLALPLLGDGDFVLVVPSFQVLDLLNQVPIVVLQTVDFFSLASEDVVESF